MAAYDREVKVCPTNVIYDRNYSGLYYKTLVCSVPYNPSEGYDYLSLALARIVNYYCKVHCKLKRTFAIVNGTTVFKNC